MRSFVTRLLVVCVLVLAGLPGTARAQDIVPESSLAVACANPVVDPGFESYSGKGPPYTLWTETTSNMYSPLCTTSQADCDPATSGVGPHSGLSWGWFGITTAYAAAESTLSQQVTIPTGSNQLTFWFAIKDFEGGASANQYFQAKIDGTELFRKDISQKNSYPPYTQVTLDVSAYANNAAHTLAFTSVSMDGLSVSFLLDDIAICPAATSNKAPIDINLSNSTIAENEIIGTTVGSLTAVDDPGDTANFFLVSGAGDSDNSLFNIAGNLLQANAVFNFETKSSYSIRVKAVDQGGLSTEKAFTITVTNVNEAPTDILLSSTTVAEKLPAGTLVGTLSAVDPDAGDSHTFTLVAVGDSGSFAIVGNELKTAAVFDAAVKNSYAIRIQVIDAGALTFEKDFTITVTGAAPPEHKVFLPLIKR